VQGPEGPGVAGRRARRLAVLRELAGAARPVVGAGRPGHQAHVLERTRERLGPVDILVYVTGTNTPDRSLKRLTTDLWDRLVAVNLSGAYYAARAVLPSMRQRQSGHLIFISSISGLAPDVSGAAYQASKRGIVGLSHAIRVEEKENRIRTCVICPGLVDTEILALRPFVTPPETVAQALQPADVAEAILAVAKLPPRASVPEMQLVPTTL